ncbi:MAG: acyltransferase family protein [Ruminococcus sp.]|jgi:fucose 4-O-acetylase-like acetyltransferase
MMNKICTEQKPRDYLFDNYKALLILLVVTGHIIEAAAEENSFLYCLKWLIFSFHMPAFIFISGYFAKKTASWGQLLRKLVVPYLIFEVLYYLLYVFVIHKETKLYLLYPKFTLWYLMALFVWKVITPWFRKIPFHMVIAVLAGLWTGFSGLDDNFLSLPRILVFYPFFLLGVHTSREMVTKIREKISRKAAAAGLIIIGFLLILAALDSTLSPQIFYGRYDYQYLHQSIIEGIIVRAVCYLVSLSATILFLALLSEKQSRFSLLGERTMAVYLFHGLACVCLKGGWRMLPYLGMAPESVILMGISVLLTYILSRKFFTDLLGIMMNPLAYWKKRIRPLA